MSLGRFLVDTEEIIGFQSYQAPQIRDQKLQKAY